MENKLQKWALITLSVSLLSCANVGFSATRVSISRALKDCISAGNKAPAHTQQSDLKKQTSLIGMAYLNYIYQNDLQNPHFCQSMLLMNSQVPANTRNPYVHLFDASMAHKTMAILENVQMSFDYSIGRTNPPKSKVRYSVNKIQAALR